jgi:NADH:ubiquinone oxidoreductase subunit
MGILNTIFRALTWWDGGTLNTKLWSWRNGVKVGEDEQGNTYFRNADNTRRWVMFNGEMEASRVNADWHGWLHHTWDEPPTDKPLAHKSWEKPHVENLTGTMMAYAPEGSIRHEKPKDRSDYEAWSPE